MVLSVLYFGQGKNRDNHAYQDFLLLNPRRGPSFRRGNDDAVLLHLGGETCQTKIIYLKNSYCQLGIKLPSSQA